MFTDLQRGYFPKQTEPLEYMPWHFKRIEDIVVQFLLLARQMHGAHRPREIRGVAKVEHGVYNAPTEDVLRADVDPGPRGHDDEADDEKGVRHQHRGVVRGRRSEGDQEDERSQLEHDALSRLPWRTTRRGAGRRRHGNDVGKLR